MKYILKPDIALRSFADKAYVLYKYDVSTPYFPTAEQFFALLGCDGKTELELDEALEYVIMRGWAEPCECGGELTEWQKFREFDNYCVPGLEWAITNRCNQSCRHCYATATNEAAIDEFTWDECVKLLDDCEACGIHHIVLTGGEPLLHPHFMDIARELSKRHMRLMAVFTNGVLLTQEMLDELRALGHEPLFAISYDGINTHDWLRRTPGAEARALNAIRLVKANGFQLRVNMCMYAANANKLLASVEMLDEMGVDEIRVIRVTESSRANLLMEGQIISPKEAADRLLDIIRGYVAKERSAELELWQFAQLMPKFRVWSPAAIPDLPDGAGVCRNIRYKISVDGNGNVSPCQKISGTIKSMGVDYGNIKRESLKKLLMGSDYIKALKWTLADVRKNPKCAACEHLSECGCGCRAIALATTGDVLGADLFRCMYFEGGYDRKLKQIFDEAGWN